MDIFFALSDPTRKNIIELLSSYGQLSASEIYIRFSVSAAAISQHLKVLKIAKLVNVEKRSQQRIYTINKESIIQLEEWANMMRKQWELKFDNLDIILEEEKTKLK